MTDPRVYSSVTAAKLAKLRERAPVFHADKRARLLDAAAMPHVADVVRLLNQIGNDFLWMADFCDMAASRTIAAEVQDVINILQEVVLE